MFNITAITTIGILTGYGADTAEDCRNVTRIFYRRGYTDIRINGNIVPDEVLKAA